MPSGQVCFNRITQNECRLENELLFLFAVGGLACNGGLEGGYVINCLDTEWKSLVGFAHVPLV